MPPTQTDNLYADPLTLNNAITDQPETEVVSSPTGEQVTLGSRGKSGTYIFSGIITREEYNNDLIRFEALKNYDIMRRSDATVRAVLKVCKLPIISATWHVEAASDDQQDIDIAEFVRQQLFGNKVVFSDTLNEALTYLEFGYSVFEKVYGYTDFVPPLIQPDDPVNPGQGDNEDNDEADQPEPPPPIQRPSQRMIGLDGLESRKQRSIYRWQTNDKPPVPGITQYVPGGTYSVPMEKLCVFTYDKEGQNFEGISILRAAYKHWKIKDKLELIDAIKHERQGLGIIEIVPTEGANQTDVDDAVDAARAARASEEAVIKHPPGWVVQFMDMGNSGTSDVQTSLEYHKREISKSVLAQFLELGGTKGGSGSRAVSADHSELFEMALEHIAKYIADQLERHVVKELVDLNFSNVQAYPTLEHSKIGDENIADISEAVNTLMTSKAMTPTADTEGWLRDMLHAPALDEEIAKDYNNRQTGGTPPPTNPLDKSKAEGENTGDLNKTARESKIAAARAAREDLLSELLIDGQRIGS